MKKCPKCGYIHPKKPANRPKKFTPKQEGQIVEERKAMTVKKLSIKWSCCEATIHNILNRNKNG